MKQILLFGAGKSATVLIDYLLINAKDNNWQLTINDTNLQLASDKINGSPFGHAVSFDISNDEKRAEYIGKADLVISMLPAALHSIVAKDCVILSKHLLTASYVDEEIRQLANEINNKDLLFLCEMGLDPGIDHMSAMKIIDEIHADGGKLISFTSHCGGLVAPESDNNPWHYKISWNPRNIVLAGKAGAVYKKSHSTETIGYASLFADCGIVDVPGMDNFAYYPNRDSLSYIPIYGLEETASFIRTTLRHPDFCKGWNYIIKAGLTSEDLFKNDIIPGKTSYKQWLESSISLHTAAENFESFLTTIVVSAEQDLIRTLFTYLGILNEEAIPANANSSADVLQGLLEARLLLQPADKDMIIMLHEIEYENKNIPAKISSALVVKGENSLHTAMAKTVGLPLGIAAKLLLNGQLKLRGLHIPTAKEIYIPVLQELEAAGIRFTETIH